jgi:hypothetical protein
VTAALRETLIGVLHAVAAFVSVLTVAALSAAVGYWY